MKFSGFVYWQLDFVAASVVVCFSGINEELKSKLKEYVVNLKGTVRSQTLDPTVTHLVLHNLSPLPSHTYTHTHSLCVCPPFWFDIKDLTNHLKLGDFAQYTYNENFGRFSDRKVDRHDKLDHWERKSRLFSSRRKVCFSVYIFKMRTTSFSFSCCEQENTFFGRFGF
jgi:hypothetical protein